MRCAAATACRGGALCRRRPAPPVSACSLRALLWAVHIRLCEHALPDIRSRLRELGRRTSEPGRIARAGSQARRSSCRGAPYPPALAGRRRANRPDAQASAAGRLKSRIWPASPPSCTSTVECASATVMSLPRRPPLGGRRISVRRHTAWPPRAGTLSCCRHTDARHHTPRRRHGRQPGTDPAPPARHCRRAYLSLSTQSAKQSSAAIRAGASSTRAALIRCHIQ